MIWIRSCTRFVAYMGTEARKERMWTPHQCRFLGPGVISLEPLRLLRSAQWQPWEPVVAEAIPEILLISLTAAKAVNRQNTPVKGPSNRGSCYHTHRHTHTRAPIEGLMHKPTSAWDHVYITVTLFPSLFIEEIKSFFSMSNSPPSSCYISPPSFFFVFCIFWN